ncbi:MAG: chemotaxis protein [Desulfobacterales bacterium]|nr:chemotaxis protein [Desulfobacterales bacterium]
MNEQGILLESGTNELEILVLLVNDQLFGMNVAKVQSIQQFDSELVTKLPTKMPGVSGMFLYRSKTIPLMDLAQILEIEITQKVEREIIVVTEFNNSVNSFKVQGIKRIYRLSWNELEPFDETFGNNDYFIGSVNIENSQILIIDLEHILSKIFPDLIIEDVSESVIQKQETVTRDQLEIIFADDSPTIRKGISKALKIAGFKDISDFENGEVALKYILKKYGDKKEQDLHNVVLISDIEMPRMDGLTLCKNIKQNQNLKNIYTIMFSSLINKQMIAKCENLKADTCISKPETNKLIDLLDARCQ